MTWAPPWPALPGRPADLTPGSADIPKLTALLAELGTIQAPDDVPVRSVKEYWGYYSDNPAALEGNRLVHTDLHGGNFIMDGDRVWLLDWGWAMRGPAWISPMRFILFLMDAGWKPGDAEQAAADLNGHDHPNPRASQWQANPSRPPPRPERQPQPPSPKRGRLLDGRLTAPG